MPLSWSFDPCDPVPTIGGNISVGFEFMPAGGFDQRRERLPSGGSRMTLCLSVARADVVAFVRAVGRAARGDRPSVANLWVSFIGVDTDFTAKLIDLYPPNIDYPDGYALNLTDSIIWVRFRDSCIIPMPIKPSEVYHASFPCCYPTSNLFSRGDWIRVDIRLELSALRRNPALAVRWASPARWWWRKTRWITWLAVLLHIVPLAVAAKRPGPTRGGWRACEFARTEVWGS